MFKIIPWYYRWLAMGVFAAALIAFGFWKGIEHDEAEIVACRVNVGTLEGAVRVASAATDRWKAAAAAVQKGAGVAVDAAAAAGKPDEDESARLAAAAEAARGRPADPPRAGSCPASGADRAVAKIREGLGGAASK